MDDNDFPAIIFLLLRNYAGNFREMIPVIKLFVMSSSQQPPATHPATLRLARTTQAGATLRSRLHLVDLAGSERLHLGFPEREDLVKNGLIHG